MVVARGHWASQCLNGISPDSNQAGFVIDREDIERSQCLNGISPDSNWRWITAFLFRWRASQCLNGISPDSNVVGECLVGLVYIGLNV